MVRGVLWQFPCAIWGQARWLCSYNDRQKKNVHFCRTWTTFQIVPSVSDVFGWKERYISDIKSHWLVWFLSDMSWTMETKNARMRRTMRRIGKASFIQSVCWESSQGKRNGKVDGDVEGICWIGTFWKALKLASPAHDSVRLQMTAQKPSWTRKEVRGRKGSLNTTWSIHQTVP